MELGNDNFSLINNLKIFFRRKELVIIAAFIGMTLGACVALVLPAEYESSTIILVEEGKSDNPLFDRLAVSTTVQQRLDTIRESMLGWDSIVKLIKRLDLDHDVKTAKEFETLVEIIRQRIDIRLKSGNVIQLSYHGGDPVQTQAVVQNITDIFIDRNKDIQEQETEDAIRFIEEQLRIYKGKIKSAEIAKMEEQLDDLLFDSTEKHPLVVELKQKITAKKEELRKENLEYTRSERLELESNAKLISSIQTALQTIEPNSTLGPSNNLLGQTSGNEVAKIALIEKMEKVRARDVVVNENIYNMLLERLETAKITQRLQLSQEGTRYTIIEPARIPLEPSKPNRPLIVFAGFFMGALIGFGLVFAVVFFDKSFIDVTEAKEYLGVPLLGAISKIHTEDSLRQERDRKRWMYSLTFVAGVILLVVTVTFANMLK